MKLYVVCLLVAFQSILFAQDLVLSYSGGTNQEQFGRQDVFEIDGLVFDLDAEHLVEVVDSLSADIDLDVSRFLAEDPLFSSYAPISPYVFAINNPVIFIDADGNVVVGSDGKAVTYSVKNGQVVWSANATKDVKRIGNAMLRTATGTKQFNQMVASSTKIHLRISQKSKVSVNNKGKQVITYAETLQGNFNEKDTYGKYMKKDGTWALKEATITIYEGSIKAAPAYDSQYGSDHFTVDEVIGLEGAHESVHASDEKEVHKDIKYHQEHNGAGRDNEAKPEKIEGQARKETTALKEQKAAEVEEK